MIGRFLCGFCSGINTSLVPVYIKEMSPDAISEMSLKGSLIKELTNPNINP